MQEAYPRDMIGYGRNPPFADWPGGARVALQFVINYEEGGENNILHGDAASEAFLSEIVGAAPWPGMRHMNMESIYEYGSRAGFWRLYRMFNERRVPVTVYAVAIAMARNKPAVDAMNEAGWEIATHGLKWIDYRDTPIEVERKHIAEAIRIHTEVAGARPLGFYQGRSSINTLPLGAEEGGFVYCADAYADDLPYYFDGARGPQLIVPYTLDANDMRFATPQGFNCGDQFYAYLKDSFDTLYAEGATAPKMLSIGLHSRLVGRPGRAAALARFLDYALGHDKVWFATRLDIARHWIAKHAPPGGWKPSKLSRTLFAERFGGVYEHSRWVAEAAYDTGLTAAEDSAAGLAQKMAAAVAGGSEAMKRKLIEAHPDLAGRFSRAGKLTPASTREQASAGLDRLTPDELKRFTALNQAYREKFAFPFILAVKGKGKDEIEAELERRLKNDGSNEFVEALRQIDRIAELRLKEILPLSGAARVVRGRLLTYVEQPRLVHEKARRYVDDGAILIADGRIADIGEAAEILKRAPPNAAVDDWSGKLILPGFIDAHIHYPQTRVIGSYGAQLLDWLHKYTFVEEQRFANPAHASAVAEFFLDELFRQGTTTAVVYCTVKPQSAEAFFAASQRRGARMIAGKVMMDRDAPRGLTDTPEQGYDESKALIQRWRGKGRLGYAITPRFAITSSDAQLAAAGALAREFPDCYVQTHLSENHAEIALTKALYPAARSYLDVYDRFGLVGPRSIFGHCIHLEDTEVSTLAEKSGVAAFCPTSNLFLGSGLFDMARLDQAGVRVAIATDVGGGTSYSLLQTASEGYKVLQMRGQSWPATQAFYQLTLGNARALKLEDKIGKLEAGFEADMVVLDSRATPAMAHRMEAVDGDLDEELFVLMMMGDDRSVSETYVNGEPAKLP